MKIHTVVPAYNITQRKLSGGEMRQLEHVEYKISLCHKLFYFCTVQQYITFFSFAWLCQQTYCHGFGAPKAMTNANCSLAVLPSGSEPTFWETVKPTMRQINVKILWKGIYPSYHQSNVALIWCMCLKILWDFCEMLSFAIFIYCCYQAECQGLLTSCFKQTW